MIDRKPELGVGRQAKALGISRGSVYYLPRPTSDADLALMRRICERPLDYPFAGSRMLKGLVQAEGHSVGRLHVSTLMKKMAIAALYRRPNTSKPAPGHKVCPYLLRNLAVMRPIPASGRCQVWAIPRLDDTRSGRWTSPTFRWPAASFIWPPWSIGSAVRSWPGGCRSRCRRTSASRRWKRRSPAMAGPRSSTAIRARKSPAPTSSGP